MVSSRYVFPVAIILALALVPTVIHSYLDSRHIDGFSTQKLPVALGQFSSKKSNRDSGWGQEVFDSQDWIERIYDEGNGRLVRLFVARSYDHKRLYHHPELALSYGMTMTSQGIVQLPGNESVSANLLVDERGRSVIMYSLLYDNELVEDPISHQIKDSMNLLTGARKPMTLFYVSSVKAKSTEDPRLTPAARVLELAVQSFRSQSAVPGTQ
ncbi:MAG: exosortase-associated EpsI family protein [Gammaproteobacteria bacterium]|nr:exosortase-associated EpsI family protein [Gammaproteobacteria bacterium]